MRPAPPVGLAYIAAALREAGHRVSLLDAVGEAPTRATADRGLLRMGLTVEQMLERLDPHAEALAITNMWSHSWPLLREMIRAFRARRPDLLIVCGGEHFSALPEYSMQQAPIDYVVMGEGEEIAVQLFAGLASGADFDPAGIDGLCWRRGDEIVRNPRADRIAAVDSISWPAWDLFDLDAYNENNYFSGNKYGKTVPILATRGCPYQCTYCTSPQMWTTRWYARDAVDVADEIEFYVERYGANNFPFHDLTAIIKRDWILTFASEIIRRGLDIRCCRAARAARWWTPRWLRCWHAPAAARWPTPRRAAPSARAS
jgi:anaerobic magnesium-protoporphyrin IX monomethyl ester cyclase